MSEPRLVTALISYEAMLAEQGAPVLANLRPGIDREQILATVAPLGLVPSEELITWWEWRNGVYSWENPVHCYLLPTGRWHYSLAEEVTHTREKRWIYEGIRPSGIMEELGRDLWPDTWMAFCSSPAGFSLPAQCSRIEEAGAPLRTSALYIDASEPVQDPLLCHCIAEMIETWNVALEQRWWHFDHDTDRWIRQPGTFGAAVEVGISEPLASMLAP